ncbi:hypothetical protein PSP6_810036 [Paraburkholderia tropica]|nr:hypothetical protein PSP6_810036 [Paraburkholderia tropica]
MCSAACTCSACHIARRLSREAMTSVRGMGADNVSEFMASTSNDGFEKTESDNRQC